MWRANDVARAFRDFAQRRVNEDRPRHGTVTNVDDHATLGQVEVTLSNGDTRWVQASTIEQLQVDDEIWIEPLDVGIARGQAKFAGYYRNASGSFVPTIRPEVIADAVDRILRDDNGDPLLDDDYNPLMGD